MTNSIPKRADGRPSQQKYHYGLNGNGADERPQSASKYTAINRIAARAKALGHSLTLRMENLIYAMSLDQIRQVEAFDDETFAAYIRDVYEFGGARSVLRRYIKETS